MANPGTSSECRSSNKTPEMSILQDNHRIPRDISDTKRLNVRDMRLSKHGY
jgi:hypothetical protein